MPAMPPIRVVQPDLSEPDERALAADHDAAIAQLLPVLGPLFGLGVILFGTWDLWMDPAHATTTVPVRVLLVLAGAAAYLQTPLPWTPLQRCGFIYATHASAIVVSAFLLRDGLLYGLAGISASVFPVTLVALRLRTFLLILLAPSLLLAALAAAAMPLREFIGSMMLYLFSVAVAAVIMAVIGAFRRQAFLNQKNLLHMSRHDSLSGTYSRGYLIELAEREVAVARRRAHPLAVAMLDIDFFKRINDTYGHAVGDTVIKALVSTCSQSLREIDHFGRIGGEEFVAVLPDTEAPAALACAERMRASLEALRIDTAQGPLRFTVSIGVALLNDGHPDWGALLKDADTALYRAKGAGRNRCVLFTRERRSEGAQ